MILYKYQKLVRMVAPEYEHGDSSVARLQAKLGNLIGQGTDFFNFSDYIECICTSLTLKPNLEMGFFEENGMLYPKVFDMSTRLEVVDNSFGV